MIKAGDTAIDGVINRNNGQGIISFKSTLRLAIGKAFTVGAENS
jgi:hypothetical protein